MRCFLKFAWILTLVAAKGADPVETAVLDSRVVYTVPVATNRVTTVSFPGPIAAIDAAGVSSDPKVPGLFQLAHSKGSQFFSLRAAEPLGSANINVRWDQKTYVFEVVESSAPVLSLVMEESPSGPSVHPAPRLTPVQLLALIDKAKAFPLLRAQHRDEVSQIDFVSFKPETCTTDYGDYAIRIEEGYRFNPEDTLVFHLSFTNRTAEPVRYRPDSLAVRVGTRVYPQSISDASGLIPPKTEAGAYLGITGTPDGGRNELSLQNDFRVLVERFIKDQPITNSVPSVP